FTLKIVGQISIHRDVILSEISHQQPICATAGMPCADKPLAPLCLCRKHHVNSQALNEIGPCNECAGAIGSAVLNVNVGHSSHRSTIEHAVAPTLQVNIRMGFAQQDGIREGANINWNAGVNDVATEQFHEIQVHIEHLLCRVVGKNPA